MPGEFYNIDQLLSDKAELERQNAASAAQIAEIEAQVAANETSIENIDAIIAYINAGYPEIPQLDDVENFAAVVNAITQVYTVVLSWDAVTDATGYIIEKSIYPDFSSPEEIYDDNELTYTDEEVVPNMSYYYRVKAYAAGKNDSAWATADAAVPTQLDTPINLQLASAEIETVLTVTATWDEVLYATGYKVYRSTTGDFEDATEVADVATATYADTDVTDGTEYTYWIKAYAFIFLESDLSNEEAITAEP